MPRLIRIGRYVIFFWSGDADEPIHVHISVADPSTNSAKIWLTKGASCIIAHNKAKIPQKDLNNMLRIIQADYFLICDAWKKHFNTNDITFYA